MGEERVSLHAQSVTEADQTNAGRSAATFPGIENRRWRQHVLRRALVTSDALALAGALLLAKAAGGVTGYDWADALVFVVTLAAWTIGAYLFGLYDREGQRPEHSTLEEAVPIFNLLTAGTWLVVVAISLVGSEEVPLGEVVVFWAAAFVFLIVGRVASRGITRRFAGLQQNTIIVGAGDVGQLVGRKLLHHPEFGIKVIGFVDADPKQMRADLADVPILGPPDDILDIVRRHDVQRAVVAFSNDRHERVVDLVRSLRALDVQIDLVPRLFEAVGPAVSLRAVEGLTLVTLPVARVSRAGRLAKRTLDIVIGSLAIVIAAPIFVIAAWRIRHDSAGPVFFRQERLGEAMRPFTMLKFRTMQVDTDADPHRAYVSQIMDPLAIPTDGNLYKLDRSDAVTKAGAWLRRTSLDELPQLFNVVRGDMSLVGPRPCIPYETELFAPHHFDRFLVPAGMTGLWQVAARAHATFGEALDLDASYARNWSLGLDLRLLAHTPAVMFRQRETT